MGLRIIGGELKRKNIRTLEGMATRPTTDRVRESLFNILAFRVKEAHVLDLFAGSGALGIEAISRGALSCVFVDKSKKAVQVIRENVAACRITEKSSVIVWDIAKNLNCLQNIGHPFDLVFMDPPYEKGFIAPALTHLHQTGILADEALVVIEHSIKEDVEDVSPFSPEDRRKYGKTHISFLAYQKDA